MVNIKKGMLHRAFSVFIFNTKGELLLQQVLNLQVCLLSSQTAIERKNHLPRFLDQYLLLTSPLSRNWVDRGGRDGYVYDFEFIQTEFQGVRNAAIRKLEHELGIHTSTFSPAEFNFLTRLHYLSPSDETWGEHEGFFLPS